VLAASKLPYAEATWTRGLLVLSENLRQAKTCFCEPPRQLQTAIVPGAAISAVHFENITERLCNNGHSTLNCHPMHDEAKITNHFKGQ
jgi:hypothetical protein